MIDHTATARRQGRQLAHALIGSVIATGIVISGVILATAAHSASPRDLAARSVIASECGVRAPFGPSQLDHAFPSSAARRSAVDASRARFRALSPGQRADVCASARQRGFR